jgi:hypothetical protein
VTIDANDQCTLLFPSDFGYFATPGPATRRNVLAGDLSLRQVTAGHAFAFRAVPIEAAPEGEPVPGGRTFYRRFAAVAGDDGREPLPTVFEPRALEGGAFATGGGTAFFVWREVTGTPAPVSCGGSPSWAPLPTETVAYFDELEDVAGVSQPFANAVEIQDTATPFPFGRAVVDLRQDDLPGAQAWLAWAAKTGAELVFSATAAHHPVSCTP